MLIAVMMGGFHSITAYQWSNDDRELPDEIFPVVYVTSRGKYVCTCTILGDCEVIVKLNFNVSGGRHVMIVHSSVL